MSVLYDDYLREHKANVQKGFDWLKENLPYLVEDVGSWNTEFNHDASKTEADEYEAYDRYFYGNNKSYEIVQAFRKAWLLHIHRNPHHWQHWVLINDDPNEGEIIIEMPYEYIIEMICDWWAFSWKADNLFEIFKWYDEHKDYIKLGPDTRKTVEDILSKIHFKLSESDVLQHHGVKGQKWGVRRTPEQLGHKKVAKSMNSRDNVVSSAILSGTVSTKVKKHDQEKHIMSKHDEHPERGYIYGDLDYAQELIDRLSCTGEAVIDKNGNWTHKERVKDSEAIGHYIDGEGVSHGDTHNGMIAYSKKGSHIYPRKED